MGHFTQDPHRGWSPQQGHVLGHLFILPFLALAIFTSLPGILTHPGGFASKM